MRPEGRGGGGRRDQHEPGRFRKRHLFADAPRPFRNKEAKDCEELDEKTNEPGATVSQRMTQTCVRARRCLACVLRKELILLV